MKIDDNVLQGHEYITALKTKIQTLEGLVRLRESEIRKYRECLEEIGASINYAYDKLAPRYPEYEFVPLRSATVDFHHKFACTEDLVVRLNKINDILEKYE